MAIATHIDPLKPPLSIIGKGLQGVSWLKNLNLSGYPIQNVLRSGGKSYQHYVQNQLQSPWPIVTLDEVQHTFITAALLIPDHEHIPFLKNNSFKEGSTFILAHGMSCALDHIHLEFPEYRFLLLAPKIIASKLHSNFLEKKPIAAVMGPKSITALEQQFLKQLATALGITIGPFLVSFEEETQSDLLSEQIPLCGLIPQVVETVYSTLVESGISKELAYIECWQELSLIVDVMVNKGPKAFFDMISPAARFGAHRAQEKLKSKPYHLAIAELMKEIQNPEDFHRAYQSMSHSKLQQTTRDYWENSPLEKIHHQLGPHFSGEQTGII